MSLDVKICGLKNEAAIAAALESGATHLGFIFFPPSPRHVEPAAAARLREAASGSASVVAVTVDAGDDALDAIVGEMAPDMLQLHGSESPDRVGAVRARYGLPVIKAISMAEPSDLERIAPYRQVADRLLFDTKPPKGARLPGGNGLAFDWRILAGLEPDIDYLLSGGLTAANIGDALAALDPRGIDISSGVERAPGVKDPALISAFFRAVRAAGRAVPRTIDFGALP